ncbi:MAG: 4Fe-4S binding protein [Chloroflexi bacterium]|nr:4Fe-4S binding protein [Chloroflexota bacterium]
MSENDVYEELAKMIGEEDVVGMPPTPAFIDVLRLQFAPDEADLALKIHLSGGTLDELSERLGIEKTKLYEKFMVMADKGTIIYDPADEDPVYRCVGMTAGGLTETGVWGGIRFPYTVELGKAIYRAMRDHSELALGKLGFPYTPVWAAKMALPEDATPEEDLTEAIKEAGHWSISPCPCRMARVLTTPEDPCQHMLHTCVHTGALSRWAVKHGMARELTHEQMVELLRECNEDGLVHTINIYGQICNCCEDCCGIFETFKMGAPTFIPSPFMAQANEDTCTACGTCAERCPVDAIEVDAFAIVSQDKCIGCGVCVPTCPADAINLIRRPTPEQA